MRIGRFGIGMALGIALGAILPVAAQSVSQVMSSGLTYGMTRDAVVSVFCVDVGGLVLGGSSLRTVPIQKPASATTVASGLQIECN